MSDETPHDDLPERSGPAGGWGSMRGISEIARTVRPVPGTIESLARQNKPDGYMCASCAWP